MTSTLERIFLKKTVTENVHSYVSSFAVTGCSFRYVDDPALPSCWVMYNKHNGVSEIVSDMVVQVSVATYFATTRPDFFSDVVDAAEFLELFIEEFRGAIAISA